MAFITPYSLHILFKNAEVSQWALENCPSTLGQKLISKDISIVESPTTRTYSSDIAISFFGSTCANKIFCESKAEVKMSSS